MNVPLNTYNRGTYKRSKTYKKLKFNNLNVKSGFLCQKEKRYFLYWKIKEFENSSNCNGSQCLQYSGIWIVSFHKIKPNRNVFLIGVTIIFSPSENKFPLNIILKLIHNTFIFVMKRDKMFHFMKREKLRLQWTLIKIQFLLLSSQVWLFCDFFNKIVGRQTDILTTILVKDYSQQSDIHGPILAVNSFG